MALKKGEEQEVKKKASAIHSICLICCSLLPIGKSSLVLGSSDGGANVKNESAALSEAMIKLGRVLNICEHGKRERHHVFRCHLLIYG